MPPSADIETLRSHAEILKPGNMRIFHSMGFHGDFRENPGENPGENHQSLIANEYYVIVTVFELENDFNIFQNISNM